MQLISIEMSMCAQGLVPAEGDGVLTPRLGFGFLPAPAPPGSTVSIHIAADDDPRHLSVAVNRSL